MFLKLYKALSSNLLCFKYLIVNLFSLSEGLDGKSNIIISITTYPPRAKYLKYTLFCLLVQDVKPQGIHVYLSKDEFDETKKSFWFKKTAKRGVKYLYVEGNLRPHKKLFYLYGNTESYILTCDDDVLYLRRQTGGGPQHRQGGLPYQRHGNQQGHDGEGDCGQVT